MTSAGSRSRGSTGTSREAPAGPVVVLDDAAFAYTSSPVLTGVTGSVMPGEALALIGPNGSGKTTLLRGLLGMVRITAGSLRVNGAAPGRAPRATSPRSPTSTRASRSPSSTSSSWAPTRVWA